jgi:meso-butanediol dehydrogenase / (S,S)-butanediol dehydrogenase / diacetyl reductase
MDFNDKVFLVAGGGLGVGKSISQGLAAAGARVAVQDLAPMNVESTVQSIGGAARGYVEDIVKKLAVQGLINRVQDDFGQLDGLIFAAFTAPQTPVLEMDEWDWHRTLDMNLTAAFLLMQSAGRVMRTQGGGAIVNIAALEGKPGAAFLAGQNGMLALTEVAAREFGEHKIGVYAACNGVEHLPRSNFANLSDAALALAAGDFANGTMLRV